MNPLPPDERAYRQSMAAMLLGFVFGSVGTASAGLYLVIRHVVPDAGWGAVVPGIMSVTVFPLVGGAGLGLAAAKAVDRWHYARGAYRCVHCNHPLRAGDIPCHCRTDAYLRWTRRRPPSTRRHYRRRVGPVLLAYLGLLPVAFVVVSAVPRFRVSGPSVGDILVGHGLLCASVAVLIDLVSATLEMFRRGRRFRLRSVIFLRLFVVWPVVMAFAMATRAGLK